MSNDGIHRACNLNNFKTASVLLASTAVLAISTPAFAQVADEEKKDEQVAPEASPNSEAANEETGIVVSGIRATIQNSIESKRDSDLVFDSLSSDEIGDLPALSIGEALETLTGASSHREQGGATEISIRGLGPFLGSTTVNGRLASNGSGDRSVNFSQFPSELFDKVGIFKTQSAEIIEGGVAGQIVLESVRPLDYGKQRIQAEFKLNFNPDNLDIDSDQRLQDLGYRGTVSYVDQFDVGGGEIGISLGYSRNVTTNPEQEANVSNTIRACTIDPTTTSEGLFDNNNCDTSTDTINGLRDGSVTDDFVIARNSYTFRQNITDDDRDSVFAAVQIKPSSSVDINFDFQYSDRVYNERRNDLNFSEGRRIDAPGAANALDFDLIVGPNGELQQFTSETRVETNSEFLTRDEEYFGGGLSIAVQATSRLKVSADFSYSETQRIEEAVQIRQRIGNVTDIFGNVGVFSPGIEAGGNTETDRIEAATLVRQNGSETLNFVVQDFDVTNPDLFAFDPRIRADLEQDRFNSIWAARGDLSYELDGFVSVVKAGVRYQDLLYRDVPGAANGTSRIELDGDASDGDIEEDDLAAANLACRTSFPESGFLDSVTNGNPLFTNVDTNGNVVSTTNSFATFDALCLAQTLVSSAGTDLLQFDENGIPIFPDGNFDSIQNSNVDEETWAGYIQADFDGELASLPVRGNVGLRVVHTDVNATGFRGTLTAEFDDVTGSLTNINEDTSSLTTVTGGGSYTEFLPSFNIAADLAPDLIARFGVFRALSRPDPSDLSFGRFFTALIDDELSLIHI